MEDILRRLGNVEASVGDLRTQVGAIAAAIPGLATAESVSRIEAVLPHLATAASVSRIEAALPHFATKADLSTMESSLIKWIVATGLTSTGLATSLAFTIAKFVH